MSDNQLQENKKKGCIYTLLISFILVFGTYFYATYKLESLEKNGVYTNAIIIKKKKGLNGKSFNYKYWFIIKYNVNNKLVQSSISINNYKYTFYKVGDSIPIIYDATDLENVRFRRK